ncbi:MAG: acyl-ACP--UDP-N-acetylglucosamine O-acyltransferase [Myxococcota bacterium]
MIERPGIHRTAEVHRTARLGAVEVGPYAVVGRDVVMSDGGRIGAHAVVEGPTEIGPQCVISAHAVIGGAPQDRRHDPQVRTVLQIGAHNVFREHTTAHRGSSAGTGVTRIGSGNLFMVGSHVGHDVVVGDEVTLANAVALGGHAEVGDGAFIGGLAAIHQHVRIGCRAMVAGAAVCTQDVLPFTLVQGDRAQVVGLNRVGLRRAGLSSASIAALQRALVDLFEGPGSRTERIARLLAHSEPEVVEFARFAGTSQRGLCGPRRQRPRS